MPVPNFSLLKSYAVPLLLVLALLLSIYTHSMVFKEFTMPTYGNTFIHVASVRHMLEHNTYPKIDYSYGGNVPNLYVPFYRLFIVHAVLLTGLSIDFISRMAVMLFAVLLPLSFYALGTRLFGTPTGVAAAFLASFPGELLIYTVRPLPQALGMVLLPVAFLAIASQKWRTSLLLAFAIAMVHQEALAFLVGGLGAYIAVSFGYALLFSFNSNSNGRSNPAQVLELMQHASLALLAILLATLAYVVWHYVVMNSWNIFDIAQFKYHEGGLVSLESYLSKTGWVIAVFSLVGVLLVFQRLVRLFIQQAGSWVGFEEESRRGLQNSIVFIFVALASYFYLNHFEFGPLNFVFLVVAILAGIIGFTFANFVSSLPLLQKTDNHAYYFLFGLFFAGVGAVKNDVIGVRVFMDRFLVYLQEPLILLAAIGIAGLYAFFSSFTSLSRE